MSGIIEQTQQTLRRRQPANDHGRHRKREALKSSSANIHNDNIMKRVRYEVLIISGSTVRFVHKEGVVEEGRHDRFDSRQPSCPYPLKLSITLHLIAI